MRVGVCMLPTDPWPETLERARQIEALGFDHLWTYDHLSWRRYREQPWFTATPWLAGVAAATSRIRLGPLVASPNHRHPFFLVKEAIALDHISGGRFVLGVGAGGPGFDGTVFGGEQPTPGERAARMREFVEVLDGALTSPVYSYTGERYTVADARTMPGCVQQPRLPLAIAATGKQTLRLVARYADAWVTVGRSTEEQRDRLAEYCAAEGRDIADLDHLILVDEESDTVLASVDAFCDYVGEYRELGYTDVVFHHPRPGDPVWDGPASMVEEIAAILPSLP